jgi:hypothetical protein
MFLGSEKTNFEALSRGLGEKSRKRELEDFELKGNPGGEF